MGKTRAKLVTVPATTANIKKGIINFLLSKGHFAYKSPTVGVWDAARQAFRKNTSEPGVGDITCCLWYKKRLGTFEGYTEFNVGLYCAIEVKNKLTKDRTRKNQAEFARKVAAAGGLYIETDSLKSFVEWYYKQDFEHEPRVKTLPG